MATTSNNLTTRTTASRISTTSVEEEELLHKQHWEARLKNEQEEDQEGGERGEELSDPDSDFSVLRGRVSVEIETADKGRIQVDTKSVRRGAAWSFDAGEFDTYPYLPPKLYGPEVRGYWYKSRGEVDGDLRIHFVWRDPTPVDLTVKRVPLLRHSNFEKRYGYVSRWDRAAKAANKNMQWAKLWMPHNMRIFGYEKGENCPWEGYWYAIGKFWEKMARKHGDTKVIRAKNWVFVHPQILDEESWKVTTTGQFGELVGWERVPHIQKK